MNEPMPWRLQIAIQCMRANWFDPCGPILSDGAMKDAASLYFRMADAMLAEHARTAKVSSLNADDRENIRDLIAALRDERWKIGHMETYLHRNIVRDAANQLERLLNESDK